MGTPDSPRYHDLVVGNVVTHAVTREVFVVAHIEDTWAALVPREAWEDIWHRWQQWQWIPRRMPRVEALHG